MSRQKIIIIGGGFAGLNAAISLRNANADVLLIERTNFHCFQPLLYQVASAALSPGDIAVPLREILSKQKNTSILMANVVEIDKKNKKVICTTETYEYDFLIIAVGARHSYFGHPEWEEYAPGLKTILDAIKIRENILAAFERAEQYHDSPDFEKFLRFVIIGAGPTGVEMAGAIAEMAHKSLFRNFRNFKPEQSEIILIEGSNQVLPAYPKSLGDIAKKDLESLGVTVMLNSRVTDVSEEKVFVNGSWIHAATIIWAAGNEASQLLKTLDLKLDRHGRILVEKNLSLPGYPNIFAIGDCINFVDKNGNELPGIAPVAIQQGRFVGKLLSGKGNKSESFVYNDKGSLATIGRSKAVGMIGKKRVSGLFAWLTWGLVHIYYLISFRNRLVVLMQWLFLYLKGDRNIRLITKPLPEEKEKE